MSDTGIMSSEEFAALPEEEQVKVVEDLKVKLAAAQDNLKVQQREAIRRIQANVTEHERLLEGYNQQIKDFEDELAQPDLDPSRTEMIPLALRFFRNTRKMTLMRMEDMRNDLTALVNEDVEGVKPDSPMTTYPYRRASGEADVALLTLLLTKHRDAQRILAGALALPFEITEQVAATAKVATSQTRDLGAPADPTKPQFGTSSLGLDESLPPLPGLDDSLSPMPAAKGGPVETPPVLSEDEEELAAMLKQGLLADGTVDPARSLARALAEARGHATAGQTLLDRLATVSPAEGLPILDDPIWARINGRLYTMQRLEETVREIPALKPLFGVDG